MKATEYLEFLALSIKTKIRAKKGGSTSLLRSIEILLEGAFNQDIVLSTKQQDYLLNCLLECDRRLIKKTGYMEMATLSTWINSCH